jgi:predicted alpha/beta superfamily hydrolase
VISRPVWNGMRLFMKISFLFCTALLWTLRLEAQVTLVVTAPPSTPDTVTVAGTFNGWNPGSPGFVLRKAAPGEYSITLPRGINGHVEFKFTLGGWNRVEVDSSGNDVPNRSFDIPQNAARTYSGTVARWKDDRLVSRIRSSRRPAVCLLDSAFAMPRLGRTTRIWLYLPPGYADAKKRYPVLYMHDGQNLFDDSTAFSGEWGIDETLDSLCASGTAGCIVVGIEHAGPRRTGDFSPWRTERFGEGRGDVYLDFIVTSLKPYLDAHFRTQPDRLHTAIAGSSLGGNISLYAALKYPDVFGAAGVFSAALWFNPELYRFAAQRIPAPSRPWLMFLTGTQEGETSADHVATMMDVRRMVDTLTVSGYSAGASLDTVFTEGGTHSERFWRSAFSDFYTRWIRR